MLGAGVCVCLPVFMCVCVFGIFERGLVLHVGAVLYWKPFTWTGSNITYYCKQISIREYTFGCVSNLSVSMRCSDVY